MMIVYLNLFLIIIQIANRSALAELGNGDLDDASFELLIKDFKSVEQIYFPNLNQVINNLNSIIQNRNLSTICKQSLTSLTNGITRKEHWALSFYDASSQGKSGKLSGLKADFGHFDQCVRSASANSIQNFKGQFCMLSIKTNEQDVLVKRNLNLYNKTMKYLTRTNREWYDYNLGNIVAVCIPDNCEIERILDIINLKLSDLNLNISIASQNQCSRLSESDDRTFSLIELVSMFVLSCCLVLVLIGTYNPNGWLKHFDVVENSRKLFKKVTDPERLRYKSLHGFKFLYLLLSIMAHVWFLFFPLIPLLFGGNKNYDIGNILLREISAGSLYLPDVMFLIGGLLTSVMWYPILEKTKGRIGFFNYTVIRWLRTTPVMLAVLLIGFIYNRFGSGPFFNDLAIHMQTNCKNNFLKNLLYISNFERGMNMCLPQTWYICVDFQLYLMHYVTIYYLYKKPSTGLLIAAIQITLSCLYTFWSTYFNHLPGYLRVNEINLLNIINTEYHYFDTFIHSNVYTLGLLCGWLMVTKKNILKVKPFTDNLISLISFFTSLSIFFIPRYFMNIDSMSRSILLAIWASFVRLIFVFYFVYAFYSYSFGGARYLRFFMTLDFQLPFSRMCHSIVVAQFIYILYYFGSRRDMISFNTFDQIKEGVSAFVICSLAGYLLYLLIEAPFANLQTALMKRKQSKIIEIDLIETESIVNRDDDELDSDDFIFTKDLNNNLVRIVNEDKHLIRDEKKIS